MIVGKFGEKREGTTKVWYTSGWHHLSSQMSWHLFQNFAIIHLIHGKVFEISNDKYNYVEMIILYSEFYAMSDKTNEKGAAMNSMV